jgi:6-pyruvoyltetrahydropterin/6-carboxytetrahydropterin synthase
MYELMVTRQFSAAHCLRGYDGACARLHGHNYRVVVTVAAEDLPQSGMLMDFKLLKVACDQVVEALDHRCLNDLPPFTGTNPTSENLARHIFEAVREQLATQPVRAASVAVWESDSSCATYKEG